MIVILNEWKSNLFTSTWWDQYRLHKNVFSCIFAIFRVFELDSVQLVKEASTKNFHRKVIFTFF